MRNSRLHKIFDTTNTPDLIVHIEVNLVQVDAVVTNNKNQPVVNLTADDFEILQDGKRQAIKNFTYIDTSAHKTGIPLATNAPLAPPAHLKAAEVQRTFAVVVDDLGLAWENVTAVKHALRNFVEKDMQRNDLVALVPTGGGAGMFQQFTADPKQLLAAIDQLKYNLSFSRVGIHSFASLDGGRPPNVSTAVIGSLKQNGSITAQRNSWTDRSTRPEIPPVNFRGSAATGRYFRPRVRR